jgi:preprotein translocase subunit SecG
MKKIQLIFSSRSIENKIIKYFMNQKYLFLIFKICLKNMSKYQRKIYKKILKERGRKTNIKK